MTTNFEKIAHTNSTDELLKDIFNENDWLVNIIKKSSRTFWKEKMIELGGSYLLWSNAPENPTLN